MASPRHQISIFSPSSLVFVGGFGRGERGAANAGTPSGDTAPAEGAEDPFSGDELGGDYSASEDVPLPSEDDEGEDLFGDGYLGDYRADERLDRYEKRGIDVDYTEEAGAAEMMAARRAAEEELDDRDAEEGEEAVAGGRRRRLPGALADLDLPARRRRRLESAQDRALGEDDGPEPEVRIKLENLEGALRSFIDEADVQHEVGRRFKRFLRTYRAAVGPAEGGSSADVGNGGGSDAAAGRSAPRVDFVYHRRLDEAVRKNRQSLEVTFPHLAREDALLASWLVSAPRQMLDVFHEATFEVTKEAYPNAEKLLPRMSARIHGVPGADRLRDLRQTHLDELIKVAGVVTRRTGVFPQLQLVHFDCLRCGHRCGPFLHAPGGADGKDGGAGSGGKPQVCMGCQGKGPFALNLERTVYRNYQKITLQESPGTVPAGRLPRSKEVVLTHDLIDTARPGEEIEVTGILTHCFSRQLNQQAGFPVFPTVIEANSVTRRDDRFSAGRLTDEDKQDILRLARRPDVFRRIVKSIAPSIHGHENIKQALALAMFGGQRKADGHHRLRGDINVLLLGDPGVAKSQFLKYVEKTASRAVFTTGKGASAVGLTASVHKDPVTREWVLEGGGLVLADRGVCLIDEFDKMNDSDRVSIHEAMEQQSISISKAGIVTSLQARCSVIAAANPEGGRYDLSRTFAENVNLPEPILSRFDILCVVRDTADRLRDAQLADFVIGSHVRSHPAHMATGEAEREVIADDPDVVPQDLLRKYITYARQTCQPKLDTSGYEKLAQVYAELRRTSTTAQGMPIAVRHLESMIRIAEATALAHLRDAVEPSDVDAAIRVMLGSFLGTQKFSVQQQHRRSFARYLRGPVEFRDLLMHLLEALFRDAQRHHDLCGPRADQREGELLVVPRAELEERARQHHLGAGTVDEFCASTAFTGRGFEVDATRDMLVLRAGG